MDMRGDDFLAPRSPSPIPDAQPNPKRCKAFVEEVMDEDDPRNPSRWHRPYPGRAAETRGTGQTRFEKARTEKGKKDESPWAPFEDEGDWELAQWLMKHAGQNAIDEYLKMGVVSTIPATNPEMNSHICARHESEQNQHTLTSTPS
jgi:hypothetical protein